MWIVGAEVSRLDPSGQVAAERGMTFPILLIASLIRLVTAERARSASDDEGRSLPPSPTAAARCRTGRNRAAFIGDILGRVDSV